MRQVAISAIVILTVTLFSTTARTSDIAAFSKMSAGSDPSPWRESRLRGKTATRYRVEIDDVTGVIRAEADGSASALVHAISSPPSPDARLRWRWKIARLLDSSDIGTKRGDDYPVRVYVTFDLASKQLGWFARNKLRLARLIYGRDVPAAALCYVWDARAPEGTSVPNAYTDRVQMIVVQSGSKQMGEWVTETRNVYDDYRDAFGAEPPPITSVVIATDTDDTGETATSWFGDVEFVN